MGSGGFTLGALATALDATLDGDPARVVTGVAPLESAGPHDISFLVDGRYRDRLETSRAGAFLVPADLAHTAAPVLRTPAPHLALIELLRLFHPPAGVDAGVHPSALVSPAARVDPSASVGALAVIEPAAVVGPRVRIHPLVYVGRDVEIADDSEIFPHVVLREAIRIGRRVVIHAGAVIGSDGFGYVPAPGGHRKIPQVGTVVIEDDVEIGANTTIDRAMLGATIVRRGTKIDNLVQVGHGVEVGEDSILVAQVGISGSSRLGRGVVLAGQVGIADHVTIGDGAQIGAQSGIHADIEAGAKVLGSPARPVAQAKRIMLSETRLPDLVRKVRELERRLSALEGGGAGPGR